MFPKEKNHAIRLVDLRIAGSFRVTEKRWDRLLHGAWRAYHKALVESGVYVGGDPLEVPETGTTIRIREGKRRVQDGPYADTKEQLGGFTILELPSLDAALEWAARCPAASSGAVEVRPLAPATERRVHGMNGSESGETVHRTIERVARESYGRLVAYLSVHTQDVASAEDALSEALVAALDCLAARRRAAKSRGLAAHDSAPLAHRFCASPTSGASERAYPPAPYRGLAETTLETEFPDERLKLLFVCAHPAIDPAMHTPLMLQTVLGLDAVRIAHAFLVSPKTMGQRLVRAKTKIRDGGIRFEVPQERELPQRLDAVLEAIYAAFGIGWDDMAGVDQRGRELAEEAIWLARVLLQLMPNEAEVRGLLALMLHCEARRRRTTWTGWPIRSSFRAGPEAVVASFNRRGGTPSRRGVETWTSRPFSTRSRDSVGTCRAGAQRPD